MPEKETGKVTEAQANEALMQLMNKDNNEEVSEPSPAPAPTPQEEPAPAPTPTEGVEAAPSEEVAPAPETDDVASLKKRLEDFEAQSAKDKERYEARWKAFQDRATQNEQILRDRYLRKASTADRALRVLKATRTEQGIPEGEVDSAIRDIEGTMNPASPSYVPPAPTPSVAEEQAIILNDFLNEKGMTLEEANEFSHWVGTQGGTKLTPREQAVAGQSLDGFLRIAHTRWQQDASEQQKQTTRNDAVEAVKVVQRTQRQAAKAASTQPTAPQKASGAPAPKKKSWKDYSTEEIARLVQESVEGNY